MFKFIENVREDQLPAAIFNTAKRSAGAVGFQARGEKFAPVERSNRVQGRDHIVERVWHNFRRSTFASVERAAEIVERFLAAGLFADDGVGFEPDERAFVIVIDAAAPRRTFGRSAVQDLRGNGGVLQVAPGAAGAIVQRGGGGGERLPKQIERRDSGASGENQSVILRQALVNPEKIALHWRLVIGRGETNWAAIFAVPGMREFVRKQVGGFKGGRIGEEIFFGAIVAGFVMLHAIRGHAIAESEKEIVAAVVARAEQRARFGN